MESTICLRFLGTVQAECDGKLVRDFRSRKALALLGYLAVQGQPIPHERLADLFRADQPEARGRANLSWVLQPDLVEKPQALFSEGHTEFTVHYEPLLDRYLEIQTVGFGRSDLGYRLSDSPLGTWTPIERFYRPEEYQIPDILIYAAKAHPHLEGANLVLTYATNIVGYGQLVARDDLYYPRFLRAGFDSAKNERSS